MTNVYFNGKYHL